MLTALRRVMTEIGSDLDDAAEQERSRAGAMSALTAHDARRQPATEGDAT